MKSKKMNDFDISDVSTEDILFELSLREDTSDFLYKENDKVLIKDYINKCLKINNLSDVNDVIAAIRDLYNV